MAGALLEDPKHTITENGVHCSDPDCVISTCVNSKLSKLIRNDKNNDRSSNTLTGCADISIASAMDGMDSAPTVADTELWWRDLQSLGLLAQPAADFPFQDVTATKVGWSRPHDPMVPAPQPCSGQGMQLVRNQPPSQPFGLFHPWTEERNSHPSVLQSQLVTILPSQDSQVMGINPQIPNISSAPQYNANRGKFRTQEAGTIVKSHVNSGMAGKRSNDCDVIKNQQGRLKCTRKLFGILSLIFQAFDSPHIAELEEYYEDVLQKALIKIQVAKFDVSSQSSEVR